MLLEFMSIFSNMIEAVASAEDHNILVLYAVMINFIISITSRAFNFPSELKSAFSTSIFTFPPTRYFISAVTSFAFNLTEYQVLFQEYAFP